MENYDTIVVSGFVLYAVGLLFALALSSATAALYWRTGHDIWWSVGALSPILLVILQPVWSALLASRVEIEFVHVFAALPGLAYSLVSSGFVLLLVLKPWPSNRDAEA